MSDKILPIAIIVSRSEALVIASMLDAAGIIVHVGGEYHASVQVNSIALGGYRLGVPAWQHADASQILSETFANGVYNFSIGLQAAVIRLMLAVVGSAFFVIGATWLISGIRPPAELMAFPLAVISIPVNPQGTSDYYLSQTENDKN